MRDLIRHKLLLALSTSIIKKFDYQGNSLPKGRDDALSDPAWSEMEIYDPDIPATRFLEDSLGRCLEKLSDSDYRVLKAYVHAIQHDGVDLSCPDNIVFSGGGGKGIGYSGLIKYLSEEKVYRYNQKEITNFLKENFPGISIPEDSPLVINNKISHHDLSEEIFNIIGDKLMSAHALNVIYTEGLISESTSLKAINGVSGTSAGAITALPIALGMDYVDYSKLILDSQFNHFFMDAGRLTTRAMRLAVPGLYRNQYVNRFSELYIEELTERLAVIMPHVSGLTQSDRRHMLMNSILQDTTDYSIHHLYRQAKEAGVLEDIKESVEAKLQVEMGEPLQPGIRKTLTDRFKRIRNSLHLSKQDFDNSGGFKSQGSNYAYSSPSEEAFYISLYAKSDIDNISQYFGKLIGHKIKSIGVEKLRSVLNSKYEDAYIVNQAHAGSIIKNARNFMEQNGYEITNESLFNTIHMMCSLRENQIADHPDFSHKLCIENTLKHLDLFDSVIHEDQKMILDNALNIIEAFHTDKECPSDLIAISDSAASAGYNLRLSNKAQKACEEIFINDCNSLTFRELKKIQQQVPDSGIKDLYITATQSKMLKGKLPETTYFSHKENPDMPIRDAVRASMSIPLIFKTASYQGKKIYDGGVLANTPTKPFDNDKNTVVAMAEDDKFFRLSKTFTSAWKKTLPGFLMSVSNKYRREFTLTESMRGVFASSHHYGTVNFSFLPKDLDDISIGNNTILNEEKGFYADAMYYYLSHRSKSADRDSPGLLKTLRNKINNNIDTDWNEEDISLHKGVFSDSGYFSRDQYGKDMLKLAKDHEALYDI